MSTITGTSGDDIVTPSQVTAGVVGGTATAAADLISGAAGNDSIDGGGGNDTIEGGGGGDTLAGGSGTNTLSYKSDTTGVTISLSGAVNFGGDASGDQIDFASFSNFIGGAGNDYFQDESGSGDNLVDMGAGDDTADTHGGDDTLIGGSNGAGGDTVSYANAGAGVTVSLAVSTSQNTGVGQQQISGFENLYGSQHDDKLTGDGKANVLTANGGTDTLEGGKGNDTLDGSGGGGAFVSYAHATSAVHVDIGAGTATGGDGSDTLINISGGAIGSAFNDTLIGSAIGFEVLTGGAGADSIDGGGGKNDVVSYAGSSAAVTVNLATGLGSGGDAQGDHIVQISDLTGSSFGDLLTGDGKANFIQGGAGNDTIDGKGGADVLDGGAGNNTFSVASDSAGHIIDLQFGTDSVAALALHAGVCTFQNATGGSGADWLIGDARSNMLTGGGGNDTLDGGIAGNDTLIGGGGVNMIVFNSFFSSNGIKVDLGSALQQTVAQTAAGASNLTISGIDDAEGTDFADVVTGNGNANTINVYGGNDTVDGAGGKDTVFGGSGDDSVAGGAGNDSLNGGNGDDVLQGGAGADTIDGGGSATSGDWASYANSAAAVNIALWAGTGQGGDAQGDVFTSIGNLRGSAGNDTLVGDGGNNIIDGGAGNDSIDGGGGFDTLSYASATAGVTFTLGATGSFATGGGGKDTVASLFFALVGGAGNDTLTGSSSDDTISGGGGNDIIAGGGGADLLDGGAGNDTVEGGAGADSLEGGLGVNTVSYAHDTAGVVVDLSSTVAASGGEAQGDVLSNFQNLISGSGGDLVADGLHQNNNVDLGAGNDWFFVRDGNDTIAGGANAVGSGDTLSYQLDVFHGVSVSLAVTTAQNTGNGTIQISGFEYLFGSSMDDKLTGDANDNQIGGNGGNDTLEGGGGADIIDGGPGHDFASYVNSAAAVTVNLSNGTGIGGEAQGDLLSTIEGLIGSKFGDKLTGADANLQVFIGGGGADTITGGNLADDEADYSTSAAGVTVDLGLAGAQSGGDAAGDVLSGIEWAQGSKFADRLTGDGGANNLIGLGGNDTLEGRGGGDSLDGGAGVNTLSYEHSSAGVLVNFNTVALSGGDAQGDQILLGTLQNLLGGSGNDTLTGDGAANSIDGGAGNDVIDGVSGSDTLKGGAGNDTLSFINNLPATGINISLAVATPQIAATLGTITISGFENLDGTDLGDTLVGTDDVAVGNILKGNDGNDLLKGGKGNDSLYGGNQDDTLSGGAGADLLDGGTSLTTGDWADYSGSAQAVQVHLDSGSAAGGDAQGDQLVSIENVRGSANNDQLVGTSGNNVIQGGAGSDTLDGNGGLDTVSYAEASAAVSFDLSKQGGAVQATGGGGSDKINGTSFVNLIGGGGADSLLGDTRDNSIVGGAGNDTIAGGGDGNDILDGGAGVNTVSYAAAGYAAAGIIVDLPTTFAQHGLKSDVIIGFRNVIGTDGGDAINGDTSNNRIDGGKGDDAIFGGIGGNDTLIGGAGTDTLEFLNATHAVTFDLSNTAAQNIGSGMLTASGFEIIEGSNLGDKFTGTSGVDTINGGGGNDTISGGAGADHLDGGAGFDTLSYQTSAHGVHVDLATNVQVALAIGVVDDAAGDVIGGFESVIGSAKGDFLQANNAGNVVEGGLGNDTLVGNGSTCSFAHATTMISFFFGQQGVGGHWNTGAGDDYIAGFSAVVGGSAGDLLVGEIADDTLTGALGADTLTGGAGSDKFIYKALADKGDHITDFVAGTDVLLIDHSGFTNTSAGSTFFAQGSTPVALDHSHGWFLYDTDDGKLYFDDDGSGAHARVLLLTLDNKAALSVGDIVVQ